MKDITANIEQVSGRAVPVRGNDIDTDQIIPARFMKVVTFDGLGEYAFFDLRYDETGARKAHPFNEACFTGAEIMLVNRNFGCGSSREHAPQALMRAGIRAVIGESFAEIFQGNCTAMGIPVVTMSSGAVHTLMGCVEENPALELIIDLPSNTVSCGGENYPFVMHPAYRSALMSGSWDSTSVLLSNLDLIREKASGIPYMASFGEQQK